MVPEAEPTQVRRVFEGGYLDAPIPTQPGSWSIMDGRLSPHTMEVYLEGDARRPQVWLHIELVDGLYVCKDMRIAYGVDTDFQHTDIDRQAFQPTRLVPLFVTIASLPLAQPGSEDRSRADIKFIERELGDLNSTRRSVRRRTITPMFLESVARAYMSEAHGGLTRVEKRFGVSKNSAARYVAQARKAGLIPQKGAN